MRVRFPRLSAGEAERVLSTRAGRSITDLEHIRLPALDGARFAPTGPPKVQISFLLDLRDKLTAVARSAGFPDRSEAIFRQFDTEAAILLEESDLPLGQVLLSETWCWIAVHLTPHLVEWRFGKEDKPTSRRRYAGIIQRNAVGRLWYRAHVMVEPEAEDKWSVLKMVTEDAHVAVLERTSIARNYRLAKNIVRTWSTLGGGEQMLRAATIRIRLRAIMLEMSALSEDQMTEVIALAFQESRQEQQRALTEVVTLHSHPQPS